MNAILFQPHFLRNSFECSVTLVSEEDNSSSTVRNAIPDGRLLEVGFDGIFLAKRTCSIFGGGGRRRFAVFGSNFSFGLSGIVGLFNELLSGKI